MTIHDESSGPVPAQRVPSGIQPGMCRPATFGKIAAEAGDARTRKSARAQARSTGWKRIGVGSAGLVLAIGLTGCTSTEDATGIDQTSTTAPSEIGSPSATATPTASPKQWTGKKQELILVVDQFQRARIEARKDPATAETRQLYNIATQDMVLLEAGFLDEWERRKERTVGEPIWEIEQAKLIGKDTKGTVTLCQDNSAVEVVTGNEKPQGSDSVPGPFYRVTYNLKHAEYVTDGRGGWIISDLSPERVDSC